MKSILITGGTGLIGSKLIKNLDKGKYKIYILSRRYYSDSKGVYYIKWDPKKSKLDLSKIKNIDTIINLAGESIDGSRWTNNYKRKILESRVNSTKLLFEKIKKMNILPKSIISASATGYYKNNTLEPQNESSNPGDDFLSDVVVKWEKEILKFKSIGIRTTIFRIGLVLSKDGGVLKKLYPIFKLFLGVPIGSGNQIISWIHEKDMIDLIIKAIEDDNFEGIYNAVAPERINNKEFTKSLSKALGRFSYPNIIKAPSLIIKIIFGEQSNLVLNGLNVTSKNLSKVKFIFKFSKLDSALSAIYKKN